jgi:protein SCO1/2
MTRIGFISALWLAGAGLLITPGLLPGDTWDTAAPAFTKPHDLPAQDLLNMRGADRPTPLSKVNIEQKLNSRLPLETVFTDDSGHDVKLGQYFTGKRPVLLTLVYYECPMLCTQVLNGLVRAARVLPMLPGKDFDVVVISFDAREGTKQAAEKKASYVKLYGRPETAGSWHFLTGSIASIKAVTEAVGFSYIWDVHTAQFAHASAIYVVTPDGKLSKYFMGIEYSPKDLRLGLVDASAGKVGTLVDQVLLFCYHFDPQSAKYTPFALGLLRVAGAATALTMGGFVVIMLRRESRQKGNRAA